MQKQRANSKNHLHSFFANYSYGALHTNITTQAICNATFYSTFGMVMPGRSISSSSYRYGFNGKEKDGEISEGDYDFGDRIYDSKTGRWLAVDFLFRNYPFASPYCLALNTPIQAKDPDGQKVFFVNGYYNTGSLSGLAGTRAEQGYWNPNFITAAEKYLNDKNTQFIDGRGKWNSTGGERFNAGYEYAKANYCDLITGVVDEKGVQTETIKIVSHSMGAAYSEGMVKYFEEQGLKVEKVVHLSPADPSTFTASPNPQTLQLNLEHDAVLMYKNFGEDNMIPGVDRYGEVKTPNDANYDIQNSHIDTKLEPNTWDRVGDLGNVQMQQTNNTMSTPFGTFTGPSNTYQSTGNGNGTQFNFLNLEGTEYSGTGTNNEYKGPLR